MKLTLLYGMIFQGKRNMVYIPINDNNKSDLDKRVKVLNKHFNTNK